MSQRTIILLFAALILFLATGFILAWYFLFASNASSTSGEQTAPGFFDFLNYSDSSDPLPPPTEEEVPITEETNVTTPPRLRLITKDPTSAVIATTTKDGLVFRFIDRANGNVYDVVPDTLEKVRKSNTTLLRLQEAYWAPNANDIIIRFLDEDLEKIDTYLGQLTRKSGTSTDADNHYLDGSYLDVDAKSLAVSRTGNSIAYTLETPAGTGIYSAKSNGSTKTLLHVSPIRDWLLQWVKADTIALTTKPSASAPGFMYYLSTRGGEPDRIIPGTFGLTTLASPTGERILYSESVTNGLRTYTYNRTSRITTLLPIATLPEKCVWSLIDTSIAYCGAPDVLPATSYPDAWYMGLVQFRDHIWKIDAANGGATLLEIPGGEASNGIDMVDLSLSRDETYLLFRNRTDDSIWSYSLEGI